MKTFIMLLIVALTGLLLTAAYITPIQSATVIQTTSPTSIPEKLSINAENVAVLARNYSVKGTAGYINSMVFSSDGTLLAVGDGSGVVEVWESQVGKQAALLKGHTDVINDLNFSHDGRLLVSASRDKTIKIWDITTGQVIGAFEDHVASVTTVNFGPDNKTVLSSGENDAIFRELSKKTKTILAQEKEGAPAFTAKFSPDGSTIAISARNSDTVLWSVSPLNVKGQLSCNNHGFSADVFTPIAFSPEGSLIACGLADGSIEIWDVSSRKKVHTFQQKEDSVKDLIFSPNGKLLVSVGYNTVRLWNVASEHEMLSSQLDCSNVTNAAFDRTSSLVVYAAYCPNKEASFLEFYSTETGHQLASYKLFKAVVTRIAVNPDGTQVVAANGGGEIQFWTLK